MGGGGLRSSVRIDIGSGGLVQIGIGGHLPVLLQARNTPPVSGWGDAQAAEEHHRVVRFELPAGRSGLKLS